MFKSVSQGFPLKNWILITIAALIFELCILFIISDPIQPTKKRGKCEEQLIDLKNFEYLIGGPSPIPRQNRKKDPFFVIIVSSDAASGLSMRKSIRYTWAHADNRAATFFALGAVDSEDLQKSIEQENDENDDIIQGNFLDGERNCSYKHMMSLKWFRDNYPNVKYLVKMDDHVFANVPAIYNFLSKNPNDTDFLMGMYYWPALCPRTGPDSIPVEEYAADYFPSFASSSYLIYSSDVIRDLYDKSCLVYYFWRDDIHITGTLRYLLNVAVTPIQDYVLTEKGLDYLKESSLNLPKPANFMFSTDLITEQDQRFLWGRTEWYRFNNQAE